MTRYTGPGAILGGLPITATVRWTYDDWTREHDFEIEGVYWRKRNGEAGKPASQAVMDGGGVQSVLGDALWKVRRW